MTTRKLSEQSPEVSLSTPWDSLNCNYVGREGRSHASQPEDGLASHDTFIIERSRVHETYIKEHAKTKRLALILTAVLVLASFAVVLFAPAGRETLSYWLGGTLLVFAAGAAGYGKVWAKAKAISLGAEHRSDR